MLNHFLVERCSRLVKVKLLAMHRPTHDPERMKAPGALPALTEALFRAKV